MKTAKAKIIGAKISMKHSLVLCKHLRGMSLKKATQFLEDLIAMKKNIDGKYYTNASKKFLELLKSVEANAKVKGLNVEKLFIKTIKAENGRRAWRPRSRWILRGQKMKSVNLTVEVGER
jgi:ribosomal protein L22